MFSPSETKMLELLLQESQRQVTYYATLAGILTIFAWFSYGATRRNGSLIIAIILSVAIWYYPWRYYSKGKAIKADLEQQQKITCATVIEDKYVSKINRLKPYYYICTDEADFEVEKADYDKLQIGQAIQLSYAEESLIILDLNLISS